MGTFVLWPAERKSCEDRHASPLRVERLSTNKHSYLNGASPNPWGAQRDIPLGFAVDNGQTTAARVADPPAMHKRNAVAHEAGVVVTGARPGESPGKRELFTENTTSVLVFENGGVIRLGTDVIVGQLLFLTHRESKQEVVAQVIAKQRFHAGSPYIELEFTEAARNFWGVEFPARPAPKVAETSARPEASIAPRSEPALTHTITPAPAPAQAATTGVAPTAPVPTAPALDAELLYVLEEAMEEPDGRTAAPSAEEVERLRLEVEALRVELQSLRQAPIAVRSNGSGKELLNTNTPSEAVSAPPLAEAKAPKEPAESAERAEFSAQDLLPPVALDFSRADKAIEQSEKAERNSERKGGRQTGKASGGKTLTLGLLAAVLLASATGLAWYQHWLPRLGRAIASPSRAATPAPVAPAKDGQNTSATPADANSTTGTSQTTSAETAAGDKDAQNTVPATDAVLAPEGASDRKPYRDPAQPRSREQTGNSRTVAGRGDERAANKLEAVDVAVVPEGGATVPPKLLHSVRAMPPPEAVREFVTGNVNLDAVVDASGHVSSMKVLSGPTPLRSAAMNALRQYRYEPAKQNGRAVATHINVTVQFWYEP
jgi:TonB family protein